MSKPKLKVDLALARKVDKIVCKGLCCGVGSKPGNMCVEAAVHFALHGDDPGYNIDDRPLDCVDEDLVSLKISINDKSAWKDKKSRAQGLRAVAIAQLGSANYATLDFNLEAELDDRVGKYFRQLIFPRIRKEALAEVNKEARKFAKEVKAQTSSDAISICLNAGIDFSSFLEKFSRLTCWSNLSAHAKTLGTSKDDCIRFVADVLLSILRKKRVPGMKFVNKLIPRSRQYTSTLSKRVKLK